MLRRDARTAELGRSFYEVKARLDAARVAPLPEAAVTVVILVTIVIVVMIVMIVIIPAR